MIASPALVPLSALLEARPAEEPAVDDEHPIEAQLAGRWVWVTAVLERTGVYRLEHNAFAERGVARFDNLLVDPASITWRPSYKLKWNASRTRGQVAGRAKRYAHNDEGELAVLGTGAIDELQADEAPTGQAEPISTPRPQVSEPEEAAMPKVCELCGREDGAKLSERSRGRVKVLDDGICALHGSLKRRGREQRAIEAIAAVDPVIGGQGTVTARTGTADATLTGWGNPTIVVTADLSEAFPDLTPLSLQQLDALERLLDTAAEAGARITELENEVSGLREQLRRSETMRSELEARIGGLAARLLGP